MGASVKHILATMIALLFLAGAAASAAGKTVTYAKDTVWSGTAEIEGLVIVAKGVTLKIEPGTVIKVHGYWNTKLIVQGSLHAIGTKEKPIRFDIGKDNSYWGGITFWGDKAKGSVEWCEFMNGRRVTITCDGASPVIRHNTFVYRTYGGGGVLCRDGSKARIEQNKFTGGSGSAIRVVNAAPQVLANTFSGFAVGVQVAARTSPYREGLDGNPVSAKAGPVPANVTPTCKGNICDDGINLFDERVAGGKQWKASFTTDVLGMGNYRGFEVQHAKGGDTVILTLLSTWRGKPKSVTQHTLRLVDGKFVVQTATVKNDLSAEAWRKKWAEHRSRKAKIAGQECRLTTMQTVLGQLWMAGCSDTKPAHVLLTSAVEKGKKAIAPMVLWASPSISRGHLLPAFADFDGDGRAEIIVATNRGCEGKGKILVFAQEERVKDAE